MENQSLLVSQIRQRLEILYQMVNELEGGGSPTDAYTKAQTDALLNGKADKSSTYTKTQVDTLLSTKAGTSPATTQALGLVKIGSGISVDENGTISASAGTTDYTDLSNKPQINSTTLTGNLSASDLGLATSSALTTLANKLDDLFAVDSITLETDDEYPSSLSSLLTLHSPINLNNVNYYFFEETGVDYSYFAIDTSGAYPKISLVQLLKDSHRVVFYDFTVDTVATQNSDNFITSGAVYTGLSGKASTADQAIDRAALVELVDGGAKNLSNWYTGTAATDGTTIATGVPISYRTGDFVFSYDTSLATGSITIGFRDGTDTLVGSIQVDNATKVKTAAIPAGAVKFNVYASKAGTYNNFMICSKADWDISHAFQPYRPTYQELYEMVQAIQPAQT